MLEDNMPVVLTTSVPTSFLKNNHNTIDYQRVRETIKSKIVRFACIETGESVSDILNRPLSYEKLNYLVKIC
jgi:hypothetical protein